MTGKQKLLTNYSVIKTNHIKVAAFGLFAQPVAT